MKISKLFKSKGRRRKITINPIILAVIMFVIAAILFNYYSFKNLTPGQQYYSDTLDATFPIMYQIRNDKKINEIRGFVNERYNLVSNETITILNDDRKLDLLVKNNGNTFNMLEYEV